MNNSLKAKMLLGLSLLLVIMVAALAGTNYWQAKQLIMNQEKEQFHVVQNTVEMEITDSLGKARLSIESVVNNPDVAAAFASRDRERLRDMTFPIFQKLKSEGVVQFQFHLPDSTSFFRAHQPDKFGDDLSSFRNTVNTANREKRIVEGLEEGKGGYGFRVVVPLSFEGQHMGTAEYGLDFGQEFLNELQSVLDGEFFIYYILSAGDQVAWEEQQADKPMAGTVEQDTLNVPEGYIEQLKSTGQMQYFYTEDQKHAVLLIPYKDYAGETKGYIKAVISRESILGQIRATVYKTVLAGLLGIILVIAVLYFVITRFLRPLGNLAGQMQHIAQTGDLTKRAEVHTHDEVGKVAQAFNTMLDSMGEVLDNVRGSSQKLNQWGEQISSGSDQAAAASQEIAAAAEKFVAGSRRQVQDIEEITATLSQMSKGTEEIAGRAQETNRAADSSLQVINEGETNVKDTVRQMQNIGAANDNAVEKVKILAQKSEEIRQLTALIAQVADQTNLLALNAAIEAARAGEQGRGFAVVAEEVRKLAEEAAATTDKIGSSIAEIVRETGEVVVSMEKSSQEVNHGMELVNRTGEAFNSILKAVSDVHEHITEISASTQELAAGSEQVVAGVEQVAEVAQQTASESEQSAAATEEQSAVVEEISGVTEELKNEALYLQELISKFLTHQIAINCWDVLGCSSELQAKCPAYRSEEKRCWLIPETWCGGMKQGTAAEKREKCMHCEFFQKAFRHA